MRLSVPAMALVALALAGCATPLQPYNIVTGGYSETKLAPDTVRIVFRGNSSTSQERTQDLALLRAAEMALEAGFPYFSVLQENVMARDASSGGPTDQILVQFVKTKPVETLSYDAEFLSHTVRAKYQSK